MKDYTTSELRSITESYVRSLKERAFVLESFDNPSYEEVKSAYRPEAGSEAATVKIVPTVRMMSVAYGIFNSELFDNALPKNLPLIVRTETDKSMFGFASYSWRSDGGVETLTPTGIRLNSKYRMTFHEWLEVILHECVHVLEYVQHPEPFMRRHSSRGRYDAHGAWFLSHGQVFDELGFNVRKYCMALDGTYEINLDDYSISRSYDKSKSNFLIARMTGPTIENDGADVKISRSFRKKLEHIAVTGKQAGNTWWDRITKIEYYTTENPFFINWKRVSPRDYDSSFTYKLHDFAEKKYGPLVLDSVFDVNAEIEKATSDSENRGRFSFLRRVSDANLTEKIFRSIVGRKFGKDYRLDRYVKYITPVLKNDSGMMVDCVLGRTLNGKSIDVSVDSSQIILSRDWVNDIVVKCDADGCLDDYYIVHDFAEHRDEDGLPSAKAANMAIDDAVDRGDVYGKGNVEEQVRDYIMTAVADLRSWLGQVETDGELEESVTVQEDIDEMPNEERNLISDEYARNIWNVKGVVSADVRGDGSVEVSIF